MLIETSLEEEQPEEMGCLDGLAGLLKCCLSTGDEVKDLVQVLWSLQNLDGPLKDLDGYMAEAGYVVSEVIGNDDALERAALDSLAAHLGEGLPGCKLGISRIQIGHIRGWRSRTTAAC